MKKYFYKALKKITIPRILSVRRIIFPKYWSKLYFWVKVILS
jgi:hypothetical protein